MKKYLILALIGAILILPAAATVQDDIIIRQMVATDKPAILMAANDWEKVNILRQWAYEHLTLSMNLTYELSYQPGYSQMDALQMFTPHIKREASAWCAGMASALMRLYEAHGYKAYYYAGGNKTLGYSHAIVLVDINYQGVPILVSEDPYFNLVITRRDGSPLPFPEFISKAQGNDFSDISLIEGEITDTGIIDSVPMQPGYDWIGWAYVPNHSVTVTNGIYQYWGKRTAAPFNSSYQRELFRKMNGREVLGGSVYYELVAFPMTTIPVAVRPAPATQTPTITPAPTAVPTTTAPDPTPSASYRVVILVSRNVPATSEAAAIAKVKELLTGFGIIWSDADVIDP